MSVIGRIYNLLKSNIESRFGKTDAEDSVFDQTGRSSYESGYDEHAYRTSANTSHTNAQSFRDPKLAQYYANLEVPYGSDLATVQAAWKRLMRQYHPDRHGQDVKKRQVANELVQELNHAYQELKKRLEA